MFVVFLLLLQGTGEAATSQRAEQCVTLLQMTMAAGGKVRGQGKDCQREKGKENRFLRKEKGERLSRHSCDVRNSLQKSKCKNTQAKGQT